MTAPELAIGALVGGKYRIERVLGRGGMGAVYLATNEDLGRKVAIKVLLPELARNEDLLRRFRQEARTAASIDHPGIVDVLDLGTTEDGAPFIVMEALDGETLGARLVRRGRFEWRAAVRVVDRALDALAAAHAKGVFHRDLKPDNIFLLAGPPGGDEAVKLLDFGIAKLAEAGPDDVSLTRTGMVFGTPLYMAPEQARGAKNAGAASDVYAMGAILYQMIAGRTPFAGESYNEVISKVLTEPAPPLAAREVPPALERAILQMLAKDPAARPPDAAAAQRALDDAAAAPAVSANLATAPTLPPAPAVARTKTPTRVREVIANDVAPLQLPRPRRATAIALALGATVTGVAVVVAIMVARGPHTDDPPDGPPPRAMPPVIAPAPMPPQPPVEQAVIDAPPPPMPLDAALGRTVKPVKPVVDIKPKPDAPPPPPDAGPLAPLGPDRNFPR